MVGAGPEGQGIGSDEWTLVSCKMRKFQRWMSGGDCVNEYKLMLLSYTLKKLKRQIFMPHVFHHNSKTWKPNNEK